jgi:hypothetical protein
VVLRAVRAELPQRPVAAATPLAPDAPTPPPTPRREDTQRILLQRAQVALSDEPTPPLPADTHATLGAALSAIELLTVQMAAAAQSRLPSEQHTAFLEELRRTVAKAVHELAG